MTVSSTNRLASFIGNGITVTFPFTFLVFLASDVLVIATDTTTGIASTLALNTDYSVVLNADQNNFPGGSITLLGGALAVDDTLTITSDVPNTQPTEFTNQGGFYPEILTTALDRLTILIQQLQVAVGSMPKAMGACVVTTPGTVYEAPGPVVAVFVNGLLQKSSDYTVTGTFITFKYTLDLGDLVYALCTSI
jgi:hypothetical protein